MSECRGWTPNSSLCVRSKMDKDIDTCTMEEMGKHSDSPRPLTQVRAAAGSSSLLSAGLCSHDNLILMDPTLQNLVGPDFSPLFVPKLSYHSNRSFSPTFI